jgi:hypothetical protein
MRKLIILFIIIFAAASAAFSQETSKNVTPQSNTQKAFEKLKTLSGSWEGTVMGVPDQLYNSPHIQWHRYSARGYYDERSHARP